MNRTTKTKTASRIMKPAHLIALASLIVDNIQHTEGGLAAWDNVDQAIRMHLDDVGEASEDRYGRRPTDWEWAAIARAARSVLEVQP